MAPKTVGVLAKHLTKQKLTARQPVVQSDCLSFPLGQHGMSTDIAAITSRSMGTKPAFTGATQAAIIEAVTNSTKIKLCVRSRNFIILILTWQRQSQKS
ncbi:hypothetical protein GCM10019059_40300 [Camelimonas fluminis]|nr:hypothetical protein GCM10019059_40300 [Camelimonas fluminis]